jgi:hypothetical protein
MIRDHNKFNNSNNNHQSRVRVNQISFLIFGHLRIISKQNSMTVNLMYLIRKENQIIKKNKKKK